MVILQECELKNTWKHELINLDHSQLFHYEMVFVVEIRETKESDNKIPTSKPSQCFVNCAHKSTLIVTTSVFVPYLRFMLFFC